MGLVIAFVKQYWYLLLAMAAVTALFAGYFLLYAKAQRPKSRTLEWISQYDRPALLLSGTGHSLQGRDIGPLLLACTLGFFSWYIQIIQHYAPQGLLHLDQDRMVALGLNYLVLPVLSVGILYCLIKALYGRSAIAFLSALILGLDATWQPAITFFVLLGTYFTYRHLTQKEESSAWEMAASLLLLETFFIAACYFDPCMLLYGGWLGVCLFVGFAIRFRSGAKTGSFRYFFKMLLLSLVWLAVMTVLLFLPAALAAGLTLPECLAEQDFYRLILRRLGRLSRSVLQPSFRLLLSSVVYDWVLLCGGTLSVIALFVQTVRWRKPQGLLALLWYLGALTLCILGSGMALPAICLTALAGIWSNFIEKGHLALGYLCPAIVLLIVTVGAVVI